MILFGEPVPDDGRGEATLWAQREVLQGMKLGGLANARYEAVPILQVRTLGADQSENDRLLVGNVAEWIEPA